ncbi:MAG TPA: hypothetical protein VIL86_03815 [Tepidisphaeraceae bacterium]|jgi:hypothetical protein
MNHQDAEICDIVVIIDEAWKDKTGEAVEELKKAGMQVSEWDDDTGVVEGSADAAHIHTFEKMPCVDYVRKIFCYFADYPPGDPRDKDGPEQCEQPEEH